MKEDILDQAAELRQKVLDDIVKDQPVSPDYFEFKYSTGNEIGRTFPQEDYAFFSPPIYYSSYNTLDKFPKQEEFSGRVVLKRSAKYTDFISSWQSGMGLSVSARCFEILKHFNLGQHLYYPFKCELKNNQADYVFLVLDNPLYDFIDYQNSLFYTANVFEKYLRDVSFKSKNEILLFREEMNKDMYNKEGFKEGKVEAYVELKKVFVKKAFQNLDIITGAGTRFFSTKLGNALLDQGITGAQFKETRKIFKQKSI